MPVSHSALPRLTLEDYMELLQDLVRLAWVFFILAAVTPLAFRYSPVYPWPSLGSFSFTYTLVLCEFALNTVALTALLYYPNWYERIPRESASRVRWLLLVVILWMSVHIFAAFHLTGSAAGPGVILLPLLMLASLVSFPDRNGWYLAAYWLSGYVIVVLLEQNNVLATPARLSSHFALGEQVSLGGFAAILSICALTAIFGSSLRQRLFPQGSGVGPSQRIDPESGLFRRAFLERRITMELGRIQRQGGHAALLLIGLEDSSRAQAMAQLSIGLIRQIRLESDTPALYQAGVVAVLLPTVGADVAGDVSRRLIEGLKRELADVAGIRSAVTVVSHASVSAQAFMQQATAHYQVSVPGDEPKVHAV